MSLYTMIHLHHVHLFSRDLTAAIAWYTRALGAEVCYEGDFGGSRNVFMKIGSGRIHLYSQAPRDNGRGAVHHIGIRTTDLAAGCSRPSLLFGQAMPNWRSALGLPGQISLGSVWRQAYARPIGSTAPNIPSRK